MTKDRLQELIYSDLARVTKPTFKSLLRWYFFPQGSTFPHDVWFRILQYCKKRNILKYTIGIWAYFRERRLAYKYGVHVNANTEIGSGLKVVHADGIYINCKSVGKNFTIYQNVTLGSSGSKDEIECEIPTVEDNVTIYAGAVVVGNITLHEGCIIGANSFVNNDVAPYTIVAGLPARKIKNLEGY